MKHLQHLESQHEVINPLINRHCFQSNMRAVNCAYYLGKWGLVCKQSSTLLHLLLSLWKFNKFLSASSKGLAKILFNQHGCTPSNAELSLCRSVSPVSSCHNATTTCLCTRIDCHDLVSFFTICGPVMRTIYSNVRLDILKFSLRQSSMNAPQRRFLNQNWFLGHDHAHLTCLLF